MTTLAIQPNTLSPAQRLAKIVAEETDEGRNIVIFFVNAAEGNLRDFQPHHRMDAAKELVKIGIEEFADYVKPSTRKRERAPKPPVGNPDPDTEISSELQAARSELAAYARERTADGRTLVRFYSNVMEGFVENPGGFKPHHRIAAARELVKIGFGPGAGYPVAPQTDASPVYQVHPPAHQEYPPQTDDPVHQETPELRVTETESYLSLKEYMDRQISAHFYGEDFARVLHDPEIMNAVCPCEADETGETPCPNTEEECPYFGIEFPKLTEEQEQTLKDFALGKINVFEAMNQKLKEPKPESEPESESGSKPEPHAGSDPEPESEDP